jgi:serine/threonine protein kinase
VLDFGLARACSSDGTGSDLSDLPTITATVLQAGAIAGTPAYMSPEQARGQAIDKRTDIWAFGCVLYEMVTGRAAFPGETIPDTIAAILDREPEWGALPAGTAAGIGHLLRRCLDKDPKHRLRDIGDARIEIDEALTTPSVYVRLALEGAFEKAAPQTTSSATSSAKGGRLAWMALYSLRVLLWAVGQRTRSGAGVGVGAVAPAASRRAAAPRSDARRRRLAGHRDWRRRAGR